MREIKFRAKVKWNGNHLFSGDWIEGFYAHKENGLHFILIERYDRDYATYFLEVEIDEKTLGQYIGIKDKNGKEIYEGDVVTFGSLIGIIFYSESWTTFMIATPKSVILKNRMLCDLDVRDEEIIGNIHENPELLGGKE